MTKRERKNTTVTIIWNGMELDTSAFDEALRFTRQRIDIYAERTDGQRQARRDRPRDRGTGGA